MNYNRQAAGIKKALRVAKIWRASAYRPQDFDIARNVRYLLKARKGCSCSMCCNQRREWRGKVKNQLTPQERRAIGVERDRIDLYAEVDFFLRTGPRYYLTFRTIVLLCTE